jgi:hypothetical protein
MLVWLNAPLHLCRYLFVTFVLPLFSPNSIITQGNAPLLNSLSVNDNKNVGTKSARLKNQKAGSMLNLFKNTIQLTYEQRTNYQLYLIRSSNSRNERQEAGRDDTGTQRRAIFSRGYLPW